MFKWFWNWLDGLDGNVDGAVFGLGKAVKKLDKAIAANQRQSANLNAKADGLELKARSTYRLADHRRNEADRASRIKAKVEELLK